jgi:hypothetical protein
VVLVQSTSFRMDAYRIRIELFKRGLKVIEHVHLSRMPGEQGCSTSTRWPTIRPTTAVWAMR